MPRLKRLKLDALDRARQALLARGPDFFARVIQHECDHLDGNVYIDRMKDMRSLTFIKEFEDHVHQDEEE